MKDKEIIRLSDANSSLTAQNNLLLESVKTNSTSYVKYSLESVKFMNEVRNISSFYLLVFIFKIYVY